MKTRPRNLLGAELLEDRCTPAIFGTPWADARHLTLSLAPDGTDVGGQSSDLFQSLDAAYPRDVWQRELFRSFQIWTSAANISFGVVADGGQAFGTSGSLQGDPRFGDVRVGARPMALTASAVSVPPDPFLAGTWAGDIVLNSAVDWTDRGNNLCGLMLHEVGHALGLDENDDPTSAMYRNTLLAPKVLSGKDIAALRNLYGGRPADTNDLAGANDTAETASPLPPPSANDPSMPLIAFADVTTPGDADFYFLVVPAGVAGPMTVRVITAGVSLLAPSVAVYDAAGNLVASDSAAGNDGGVVQLDLPAVSAGERYTVRVNAAGSDAFAVGRYGMAVTFADVTAVAPERIQAILQGPFDTVRVEELVEFLRQPDPLLFNDDHHTSDSPASAVELFSMRGLPKRTHYVAVGSLGDGADVDYYRFEAPEPKGNQKLLLTIGLTAYSSSGIAPKAVVTDSRGRVLPAQVIANDPGQYSVQVTGAQPGKNYYVKVVGNTGTAGNYSLAIDSQMPATLLPTFAAGQIATDRTGQLFIGQNQVFHLALSAGPVSDAAGAGVQMTILNAGGKVLFSLFAAAGETASADTPLLFPGEYQVRFSAVKIANPVDFQLRGQSISDPAGPMVIDPTAYPSYLLPPPPSSYLYFNDPSIVRAYMWVLWVL